MCFDYIHNLSNIEHVNCSNITWYSLISDTAHGIIQITNQLGAAPQLDRNRANPYQIPQLQCIDQMIFG